MNGALFSHILANYSSVPVRACRQTCPDCAGTCQRCLHSRHFGGKDQRYCCERLRRLYVFRYFTAHVAQTQAVLGYVADRIAQRPHVSCASFGGGPGVELVALVESLKAASRLDFYCVDLESGWQDQFYDLVPTHLKHAAAGRLDVRPGFYCGDARLHNTRHHIVFLPWICSACPDDVHDGLLANACRCAEDLVIVTDRTQSATLARLDRAIGAQRGWQIIHQSDKITAHAGHSFPAEIVGHFEFNPRFNYETAFRVLARM